MKIVKDQKVDIAELKEMAQKMFGSLVKGMVDVEKEIMAVDAPMHSDLLEFLMKEENCNPKDVWGINIYPEKSGEDFIEFDSVMNLKPAFNNKSRGIEDAEIREKIIKIVQKLT